MFNDESIVAYYGVPLVAKGQVKGVLEIFHHSPFEADADWLGFLEMLAMMYNAIDYPLRQFFRWQRPGLQFRNEPKGDLFDHLPEPDCLAARLLAEYHLQPFHENSTANNYRENLYYLELLEQAFNLTPRKFSQQVIAADIGPSHWFYVQALHAWLTWWNCPEGRQVTLTGYEADAYRVYANFYSRHDHALAHMSNLPNVHYLPRRFERQPAAFDIITMLFPFVFKRDHLTWGLPLNIFSPLRLLSDAWDSLRPGGVLIVVNQGEDEHRAQRQLMAEAGIPISTASQQGHVSPLFQYDLPRFFVTAVHD